MRSIRNKLFDKPMTHDRYTRLTADEKRYILRNAGLSRKEREVFEEKCGKEYYSYKEIAYRRKMSLSLVKQRAVRIDTLIRKMVGESL